MARFANRPKRIARRSERDKFERLVMPAAFMCLPVGVAFLMAAALVHLVYGSPATEILVLGLAVFLIPGFLYAYRLFRGHFSRQLNEP